MSSVRGGATDPTISLPVVQVLVMLGVVATFLITAAVVASHAAAISRDADAIVGNALPSVQQLSAARGALHRLVDVADEWNDVARTGRPPPLESLGPLIDQIEASLSSYEALPTVANERELFAPVREQVTLTEARARRLAEVLRAGDEAGAEAALVSVQRAAGGAEDWLERLIAFNVSQAEEMGRDIASVRRSTRRIAILMLSIALALSVLATMLSVAAVRRGVRVLQRANALAQRKSSELDRFAGRVAHDILSPLGAVHAALGIVRPRVRGDEPVERALGGATRSVERVKRLVDGLLGYARAGARPDANAIADVGEVVRDVIDGARGEATDRGVQLEADGLLDVRVASSAGVLTSILSNLVQNAIKYMGDRARRQVTIRAIAKGDRVRLEVEDTGPGVSGAIAGSVFEPFVRGPSDQSGIGLGLATAQHLVHAHQGEIGLRSVLGEGSVFWFELPRASDRRFRAPQVP
jgi:signal transduction histidine kinase